MAPAPRFQHGRTIANLAAQIGTRFGARRTQPGLAPLADAPLSEHIAEARHIVLLLFDGLGQAQIEALIPNGALAALHQCELDSTFPSSTAPAVTTFATGSAPGEHAVTGWHVWSPAHRAVVRPLPLDFWGSPGQVEARDLFHWTPLSERMHVATTVLQPAWIADSSFTRHAFSGARRLGYSKLSELRRLIAQSLAAPANASHFVYAYLPQFDSAAHEHGWTAEPARKTANAFDALFGELVDALSRPEVLLLATADHGFIDVPAEQRLRLESFPEFAALLDGPLTGEPRVAFCRARAGQEHAFGSAASSLLGHAFECYRSEELIDAGYFGPVTSGSLRARLGSHILIGKDHYCLTQSLPGEEPPSFIGMHGGMHADEMHVSVAAAFHGNRIRSDLTHRTLHV
jgi:hypothetical protein